MCKRLHLFLQALTSAFEFFFEIARVTGISTTLAARTLMTQGSTVPTLADVARQAGVSTATVSRCLNTPEQLSETTREKVLQTVQNLGYAPNFNARALAAKRTNTVGAIIPSMENAIFARGLQAFQEELGLLGMTLLVASSSYCHKLEEQQIKALTARGADALLLIGHQRSPKIYDFLDKRGVPILVSWNYQKDAKQISIGFDNKKAITPLAEEVIALGHTNIGFISAPLSENDRARVRVEGVKSVMEASGLDPRNLNLFEISYSIENGEIAFEKLMSSKSPPSVVICGNDVFAVGAVKCAKRLGLTIPNDISITGFDDIELANVIEPGLTTVHVPHRKMGNMAARMLVDMIDNKRPTSYELDTSIIFRGTLGPPRS